jgi:hypothetical protein
MNNMNNNNNNMIQVITDGLMAEIAAADNDVDRKNASDKLMTIMMLHANSTTASAGASSSYKLDVPKLDKDAMGDWPVFKVQVMAYLKQQGIDPGSTVLPEKQESSLYLLLLGGIKDTGLSFLIINDNPTQLGTKAWQALRDHFEPDSEAHRMTSLAMLLNSGYDQSDESDVGRWLGQWSKMHDQLMLSKPTVTDLLNSVLLHHLPKAPEWVNLINGLMSSKDGLSRQKIMTTALAFDRNEQCRMATVLVPNTVNALMASSRVQAQQPTMTFARSNQAPAGPSQNAPHMQGRNYSYDAKCDRCGGRHASSACMRTQHYRCARCSEIGHYETFCGKSQHLGGAPRTSQSGNETGAAGARGALNTASGATTVRPVGTGPGWGRTAF